MLESTLLRNPAYIIWDVYFTWWYNRETQLYYTIALSVDDPNPDRPIMVSQGMETKEEVVHDLEMRAKACEWMLVPEYSQSMAQG